MNQLELPTFIFMQCYWIYLSNEFRLQFIITSILFLILGRTYVLLFKSVTPEDMGEIKFTAEKACSTAKLKVKGK